MSRNLHIAGFLRAGAVACALAAPGVALAQTGAQGGGFAPPAARVAPAAPPAMGGAQGFGPRGPAVVAPAPMQPRLGGGAVTGARPPWVAPVAPAPQPGWGGPRPPRPPVAQPGFPRPHPGHAWRPRPRPHYWGPAFGGALVAPYVYGQTPYVYDDYVEDVGYGEYCATRVKTCELYDPAPLGSGCSCRVRGGRARGVVVR